MDASYVGSRTYDINTGLNQAGGARNINVNTAEQLAQARQNPNYLDEDVPNPFAGLLPGTSLNGATVARSQLLRPYPQFDQVTLVGESIGKIWYDSLQVSVEKRYTQGLVMVLAYTWSKNLESVAFANPQDPTTTKNLTSQDRPHRLVFSGSWQLPFGKGRQFGSTMPRPLDFVFGGWEYNWIGTFQSGLPVDLPGNVSCCATECLRPELRPLFQQLRRQRSGHRFYTTECRPERFQPDLYRPGVAIARSVYLAYDAVPDRSGPPADRTAVGYVREQTLPDHGALERAVPV